MPHVRNLWCEIVQLKSIHRVDRFQQYFNRLRCDKDGVIIFVPGCVCIVSIGLFLLCNCVYILFLISFVELWCCCRLCDVLIRWFPLFFLSSCYISIISMVLLLFAACISCCERAYKTFYRKTEAKSAKIDACTLIHIQKKIFIQTNTHIFSARIQKQSLFVSCYFIWNCTPERNTDRSLVELFLQCIKFKHEYAWHFA